MAACAAALRGSGQRGLRRVDRPPQRLGPPGLGRQIGVLKPLAAAAASIASAPGGKTVEHTGHCSSCSPTCFATVAKRVGDLRSPASRGGELLPLRLH